MARTGQPAARRIAAVERAFAVLGALANAGGEAGTNELARSTGINPSTVSRLLATIAASGIVEHVPETGRYRLGAQAVRLATLARLDLRTLARPQLSALVERTGETATLSVPGEPDAVTVDFVQSSASVQSVARLGRPSVAHATATGKVLLAFGDGGPPPARLRRYTRRTITSRRRLAEEIARIREQGWAEALEEREDDLNGIAAPVFGACGELAAIVGLQGPAARFDDGAMSSAVAPLLASSEAISRGLGGAPSARSGRRSAPGAAPTR